MVHFFLADIWPRQDIVTSIREILDDIEIFSVAENSTKITDTLNYMQSDRANLAESVEEWQKLPEALNCNDQNDGNV